MKIWLDLANSPHVPLLAPVIRRLRVAGHEVPITVRDHAQTLGLAQMHFDAFTVIGGLSPSGRRAKARAMGARTEALRRFATQERPDVAFSQGSYAQLAAARAAGIPAVTMMDYEHQPANHLSFRLARTVIVPELFPTGALRRFGARSVVRYTGFQEELYLDGFSPEPSVREEFAGAGEVLAVFRPPPEGALYHRMSNERFTELVQAADAAAGVVPLLLPRTPAQALRLRADAPGVVVPDRPLDGSSLVALADLLIGGGGTMNREAAVLGTPAYTVFAGRLAAVDAELIRLGRMFDLRDPSVSPRFDPRPATLPTGGHGEEIIGAITRTVTRTPRSTR